MIIALACIYSIAIMLFTIVFLVDWIRSRKKIRKYLKYGLGVALTIFGLDLLLIIFVLFQENYTLLAALIAEPIVLLRLFGFTMLGMYYASEMGYPSFPMLLKRFKIPIINESTQIVPEIKENELSEDSFDVDPLPIQYEQEPEKAPVGDILLPTGLKKYLLLGLGGGVISIIYSVILFLLTKPQMSDLMQQRFGLPTTNPENTITITVILALFEVSIAEEIIFRLGIQNFLAKYLKLQNNKYWIAIVITSALWTLGHAGVMDPQWVKFVQIFPIGLLLGWMNKKLGVESTIIAHAVMNLILTPLSGYLIG